MMFDYHYLNLYLNMLLYFAIRYYNYQDDSFYCIYIYLYTLTMYLHILEFFKIDWMDRWKYKLHVRYTCMRLYGILCVDIIMLLEIHALTTSDTCSKSQFGGFNSYPL